MISLRDAVAEALSQVVTLVEACNQDQYAEVFTHASSTVGQHVRHILDHFSAIHAELETQCIDYNVRQRHSAIETDKGKALDALGHWLAWLESLVFSDSDVERDVSVHSEVSVHREQSITVASTLAREWMYLINHTVHHLAYATLGARQLGVLLDARLGLAPSTASFLRAQSSQATA